MRDGDLCPGTTRPRPLRDPHGMGWNVAHPREAHLPSVSPQEVFDGGFIVAGGSSHSMRQHERLPYLSDDAAANDFLAEHGFDQAGEPFREGSTDD